MPKKRAQDWGANDSTEDGYLDKTISDNRGYESGPTQINYYREPHCQNPSFNEVIGIEGQRTSGKLNRTFNSLAQNLAQTHNTR